MEEGNIRPWGYYEILAEDEKFKVKKITVNPWGRLSLQSHKLRSEVWTIIEGEGVVTINDHVATYKAHDVIKIAVTDIHRIHNQTDMPLVFVEVQHGLYFGEDDIIWYEDDYNRK